MDQLATFYPNLADRHQLPGWWVPATITVFALTPLVQGGVRSRSFAVLPILIVLAVAKPAFTSHNISDDYGSAFPVLVMPLAFLDFFMVSPLKNEDVRYTGRLDNGNGKIDKTAGVNEDDCTTAWQKIKWALRLATSIRGIGWNWQVKGVPDHPDSNLSRFDFVVKYIILAALSWTFKIACLYFIGAANAAKLQTEVHITHLALDVVIGWCGVSWAYHGLNANYRLGAALSAAIRLCDPWEWPRLFESLRNGFSVRRMWSSVWHQFIRRAVQTPGIRLARFLRLEKGSLSSRYMQLYVAFTLSMLLHEWFIFNAVRHDVGEFRFFIAQPFAITFEDFVQWCWSKSVQPDRDKEYYRFARVVGYVWTFMWFSYCLPPFIQGLLDVGIMGADVGGPLAMSLGRQQVTELLRT